MNMEEVIEVLTNALDGLGTAWIVDEAISAAIKLLAADTNVARSPWVKTSDRLPDKCDYYTMHLTTKKRNGGVWQVRGSFIKEHPELCPWWMPIPPLPEKEEQEPWPGDDLDCPNCGAMLELLEGGMLECRLCGFADNDTAEVEG